LSFLLKGILKNKTTYRGFHKLIKQHKYFTHIRMISEGSSDTEDWNNDAEDSALTSEEYIAFLKYIKIDNRYFKLQ